MTERNKVIQEIIDAIDASNDITAGIYQECVAIFPGDRWLAGSDTYNMDSIVDCVILNIIDRLESLKDKPG